MAEVAAHQMQPLAHRGNLLLQRGLRHGRVRVTESGCGDLRDLAIQQMQLPSVDRDPDQEIQQRKNDCRRGQRCREPQRTQPARQSAKGKFALAEIQQLERLAGGLGQQHRETRREGDRLRAIAGEERRAIEFVNVMDRHGQSAADLFANRGRGRGRAGQHEIGWRLVRAVREQGLPHRAQDHRGGGQGQGGVAVVRIDAAADGAHRPWRAARVDQHHRGRSVIDVDHQMSAAGAVARTRQQARQRERPERDALGIESRACQQFEMPLHILAADARESDRGVVNRKRQMLLEREWHHLREPAPIAKGQREQPLGDELARQRRDQDIGMAGRVDYPHDGRHEVGFVLPALLLPRADQLERVPGAFGNRRAHPLAGQLQRHDSQPHPYLRFSAMTFVVPPHA